MKLIEQKPVPRGLLHFSYGDQKNNPMLGPHRHSAILCHVVSRPNRVPSILIYLCRRTRLRLPHILRGSGSFRYRPVALVIAYFTRPYVGPSHRLFATLVSSAYLYRPRLTVVRVFEDCRVMKSAGESTRH